MKTTAILLAAGQGTRMKSDLPKVLHPVLGKSMIWYALEAVKQASSERPVVVVGYGAQAVIKYLGDSARTVLQDPQLGTAHAVMQAEPLLRATGGLVIVCYADMPLLRGATNSEFRPLLHADGFQR
jgi:bifunctional UDP-N-acetylglucosamine pyrophosphorylase/glucosamine-1-phosphate N-acetyltransferase